MGDDKPASARHKLAVQLTAAALERLLGDEFTVTVGAEAAGLTADVVARRVTDETVALVVEACDPETLEDERTVKAAAYAGAGVPDFWVVDVVGRRVEVCRRPGPEGFAERFWVLYPDRLTPLAAPDEGSLPLLDLMP
ncbi:MAG: Uma2 family endonuclease [Planctomycetia bacterium]